MTLDEIRDELARMKFPDLSDDFSKWFLDTILPPTLEAAAAALPEGWDWKRHSPAPYYDRVWEAYDKDVSLVVSVPDTGNEIYDRFRLGLEARRAMEVKA